MTRPRPGNAEPSANDNPRAEVARVLSSGALTRGTIDDREYVARIVAAQGGILKMRRKRVDAGIEQTKQAANAARKTAA